MMRRLALCLSLCQASSVFEGAAPASPGARLRVLSWNVAAVNNNPFEYWITHPNPLYGELMESVENFVVSPGEADVKVSDVFTDAMFAELVGKMKAAGFAHLEKVEAMWASEYKKRRIVSEFLRDKAIGDKRLASMPDRVTNTIQLSGGRSAFRPAVVNCYEKTWGSSEEWFRQWLAFFFTETVDVDGKGPRPVYSLLQKIKKSKYPAVTEEEEEASVPLQLLMQGVFDSILVSVLQQRAGATWQELRREICGSLNTRKNARLLEILRTTYADADVIFLQEAGNQLVDLLASVSETYSIILPNKYTAKRNQNSVMLLRKSLFSAVSEVEVPADGWEEGDLLVVKATFAGEELTLASFHGDTNGLLTVPVVKAVMANLPTEQLLFGMDANTHENVNKKTAHVMDFEEFYRSVKLKACWGELDVTHLLYTTFNARTYLQPQLNKAAKSGELVEKGDKNPKDFVLFTEHFEGGEVWRDNTGKGEYVEDMVFPTLDFPSDHAAVAVEVVLKAGKVEL